MQIEPSIATRPCIGPALQRPFPQLRDLVSPTLQISKPEHEDFCNATSSQPSPPSSRAPVDDPNHAPKAETNNQEEAIEEVNDLERNTADLAVSRAAPAALAAPLLLAAPAEPSRAAAAASAPRKKRSRPFKIPRT